MEAHDCKYQWRWRVKTRGCVYDCESVACELIRRSQYRRIPFGLYSNRCSWKGLIWAARSWLETVLRKRLETIPYTLDFFRLVAILWRQMGLLREQDKQAKSAVGGKSK